MNNTYLIPANTKKSMLIFGVFNTVDMIIFGVGIGIGGGMALSEIEVYHEESGKPQLRVNSSTGNIMLKTMNVTEIGVSISHTDEICTAICFVKNPD